MDGFEMQRVEHGIVKFFDERHGKRFGFLTVLDEDGTPTGEEIFFHYNEGEFVYQDEKAGGAFRQAIKYRYRDPQEKKTYTFNDYGDGYWPPWIKRSWCDTVRLDPPRQGDRIVFRRREGKGGRDKACPWGFARYEHVQPVPPGAESWSTIMTYKVAS